MTEFVEQWVALSRRSRKRRRRWRIAGAVIAVLFVSSGFGYVTDTLERGRINHAAIVTTGDRGVLEGLPEWSAANAAALMVEGTAAQRNLGRTTLLQALQQPWAFETLDYIDSVQALGAFARGRFAIVLGFERSGSALGLIDVRRSEYISRLPLRERYDQMDVSTDGRIAVLAGARARAVDVKTGATLPLVVDGPFRGVRIVPASNEVALWTADGHVDLVSLTSGRRVAGSRGYATVLDVMPDRAGGVRALVMPNANEYAIVSVPGGRALRRIRLSGGLSLGSLAPDGSRAIVAGSEQFWRIGPGRTAVPTGIAVPGSVKDLRWAASERLIVLSESERGQVFYLPRAERLGHICWDVERPLNVTLAGDGETVACVGRGLKSLWRLPSSPETRPPANLSRAKALDNKDEAVRTRGTQTRIFWRGAYGKGSTAWFSPAAGDITALSVSPSGRDLLVGSTSGQAAVIELGSRRARIVTVWNAPDSSAIVAVGWSAGPVVTTKSGQTWRFSYCAGCGTDDGLLSEARARLTRCLTGRQATWIDARVRDRVGIRVCPPTTPVPVS